MNTESIVKNNLPDEIKKQIYHNRDVFSNYNVIRMREAIRYLSEDKLKIFTLIPFLLHINRPEFPGFVSSSEKVHDVWNFEQSGFFKEALKNGFMPKNSLDKDAIKSPSILGLYHIGSLGTFTQSVSSDFDYWIIIDKKLFSKERYYVLERKLGQIVKYSREKYNQAVTFFIMDQDDIKTNCYAEFGGEETLTAPKIFLKEEFYRTFLMIAGKIPYWTLFQPNLSGLMPYDSFIETISANSSFQSISHNFIDLGNVDTTTYEDIIKGLLWHICKATFNPVKALIKATMIYTYVFHDQRDESLLCNILKHEYSNAGIDDYSVDPYKILFDRLLSFHAKTDKNCLNLIKNAIFFRLCGYPNVAIPEKNSPKIKLLNRYIREWNLNKSQISKLIAYPSWTEPAKLLMDQMFKDRLIEMYRNAMKELKRRQISIDQSKEERNWVILKNKTKKYLNKGSDRIPECSTYIKQIKIEPIHIKNRDLSSWYIPVLPDEKKSPVFYSSPHLFDILGWIVENQLYNRSNSSIIFNNDLMLFESSNTEIDMDKLYLALQPLKPLSDDVFEHKPVWKKLLVLFIYEESDTNLLKKVEILSANTWGELFLSAVEFDINENIESKHNKIILKMKEYNSPQLRMLFFQLSPDYDPDIVYMIKKGYDKLIEKTLVNESYAGTKKPYLDKL